jgi:phenylpyruvate tautomerase PptA (4-oxalocrotonate tautomerase family)
MRMVPFVFAGLMLAGCGTADGRLTEAEKNSVKVGMTKAEVEQLLGPPTTTVIVIRGTAEAGQWVRGKDGQTSSIAVNYIDGQVSAVSGCNLK